MNCKKHRHFRLGLQVPHIYEIVPKSTNFFHNFLQKTLVACLDRFKCVYDKGGPHPSTWQHCSHGNAVRRRYTPLAHRFELGGSNTPKRFMPHPPALTLSRPSSSLCSRSFAAAAPSHISDRRRRYVAMVSWSEDDSSENSHQYADSASDEGIIKVSCSSSS